MPRRKYDPKTGKWSYVISKDKKKDEKKVIKPPVKKEKPSSSSSSNNSSKVAKPTPVTKVNKGTSASSSNPTTKTKVKAKKEFKEGDSVLEGDISMRIARPNIQAKQTIMLEGFGEAISGIFFIETVKHTFNTSGYTQSLTVTRNGFGEGMQKGQVKVPVDKTKSVKDKPKKIVK